MKASRGGGGSRLANDEREEEVDEGAEALAGRSGLQGVDLRGVQPPQGTPRPVNQAHFQAHWGGSGLRQHCLDSHASIEKTQQKNVETGEQIVEGTARERMLKTGGGDVENTARENKVIEDRGRKRMGGW